MNNKLYRIDGVLWIVDKFNCVAVPLCPKHHIKLTSKYGNYEFDPAIENSRELKCEECGSPFKFKRPLGAERDYVVEKVKAMDRIKYEIVDIDGMQTPVTKKSGIDPDNGYFCTSQIRDSKRGPQIVIYAGKKGSKNKCQIFVSAEERRLSFDQNDINPADVFAKITAEFPDGTKQTIEK